MSCVGSLGSVKKVLTLALITIVAGTGCRATFDSKGNLTAPLSEKKSAAVQALDTEQIVFVHERSFQLWRPEHSEEGKTTTFVSQAAFVSADGYALTAAHAVEPKSGFTFHRMDGQKEMLRVTHVDESGLHHFQLNGQKETVMKAKLRPVRVVKRFEDTDLALIQTTTPAPAYFELAPSPPQKGERLSYGFNPVIHPELRGLEGVVTKVEQSGSHWLLECKGLAIFGDSGGSVINEKGQLVGNITGAAVSFFSWGKSKHVLRIEIEGISADTIQKAINEDRQASTQTAHQSNSKAL